MARKKPGKQADSADQAETKRDSLKKAAFLAAFTLRGNVTQAALDADVGHKTHYRWMKEDPAYKERFREARSMAIDLLEGEAWQRATVGCPRFKFHEGSQIMVVSPGTVGADGGMVGGQLVPYVEYQKDTTLLIFLLKALRPKKFRDNVKVEQSGSVDLKLSGAVSALPTPEEALKRLADLAKRLPKKPKG